MMKKLNKIDRPLLPEVPKPTALSIDQLKKALNSGVKVIDTRTKAEFAKGFIPGTINIQGNNSFATWMGWFVSYDEPFIIIAEEANLDDLARKLMRIGMDNLMGYVDGVQGWENAGEQLSKSSNISLAEFKDILRTNHTQIVDLRGASEYRTGHIAGTENLFIGTLEKNLDKIKKDEPIVIHCQAGDRATIGYSILAKHGFKNIKTYVGGMNEWTQSGNKVVQEE